MMITRGPVQVSDPTPVTIVKRLNRTALATSDDAVLDMLREIKELLATVLAERGS